MQSMASHNLVGELDEEEDDEEEEEVDEAEAEAEAGAEEEDEEEVEEEEWVTSPPSPAFLSGSKHVKLEAFSHSDAPEVRSGVLKTFKPLTSPQCSMDDDSSTASEGEVALGGSGGALAVSGSGQRGYAKQGKARGTKSRKRVSKHEGGGIASSTSRIVSTPNSFTSSEQLPIDYELSQVAVINKRKSMIKELASKYHTECLAHCRELLVLQRQWRQELQAPIPGLVSFDSSLVAENATEASPPKSDGQIESTSAVASKIKASPIMTPESSNGATADVSDSLKASSKGPLRRYVAWRANEREALRRGLMMFGLGRSEKVRGVMRGLLKQLRHGLGDIADCCWEFVRACAVHADQKESAYAEKLPERAKDLGVEMGPEVSERVGLWERMEKSGLVWLKRLRLLDSLGDVVRLCANPETQEAAYSAIDSLSDATLPANWWTRESDLALLAGIYKHGFGNYEALRTDEQYAEAFRGIVEGNWLSTAAAGDHKAKADTLLHNWEASGDERVLSNVTSKGYVSGETAHRSSHDLSAHDGDAQLIYSRDAGDESLWPDSNTLTRRLKRLLEHIGRIGQQAVKVEKGTGRKARQGRLWSKREKLNFLRILLTWGLPVNPKEDGEVYWQFFKDQASVRPLKNKKDSSLEACYRGLLEEMKELLEGSDSSEDKAVTKKIASASIEDDGSTDGDGENHMTATEVASQAGPTVLTHKSAVRLRDRLELFGTLRQALDFLPEDWSQLGLTIHQSHSLPCWWEIGHHDKELSLGVLKHGFGNWDSIFEDSDLSFKEVNHDKYITGFGQDSDNIQSFDSLWGTQTYEEGDEQVKNKGKRNSLQGVGSSNLPSPKSCVKRLKFIGSVLRRQLNKHTGVSKAVK